MTEPSLDMLSHEEIVHTLLEQRADIANDVDRSIDDFIANTNRNTVKMILKAISAYGGKPEEGFAVWKQFMQTGDSVELRAKTKKRKIPLLKFHALLDEWLKSAQRQEGVQVDTPEAEFVRGMQVEFAAAAAPLSQEDNRGGLDFRQETVFDTFLNLRMQYEGPGAVIEPLTATLATHLKRAVEEKLLPSYAALKSQEKKPLVDESIIHGLRDAVKADALARFDRLTAQSYGVAQKKPLFDYKFLAEQMPAGVKFGVEFEGFTNLKKKHPDNLESLSAIFRRFSLPASPAMAPKQDRVYNEWKFTIDTSIIDPLHFNGRYKLMDKIDKSSGVEVVSPILNGQCGHNDLMLAANLLEAVNYKTNDTCGLHVHVDLEKATLEQRKNLVRALYHNEAAMDKLIDPARRGNKNMFTRSISRIDLAQVDAAKTTDELVKILNPGNDAYYKFDMTGLVLSGSPPTIQYRGAGGAGYLNTVGDYTVILVNFTRQALDNPNVRLADVIGELVTQRDELQKALAPRVPRKPAKRNPEGPR